MVGNQKFCKIGPLEGCMVRKMSFKVTLYSSILKRYLESNGGTSLVVKWLRLRASTAGDSGSIPVRGTKIPHATWHGPPKKSKQW